ncbi:MULTISPECIES: undecaprenyldiphospho-muramoylpentapeptide beta-N-acetylglucosaminyltransferase [unclassified Fusibacter]|uniref:undecaprenyldiphospho-muramoylpentapeptide beta-N-acetylglucosaminyltransferase n=1 Tax=unclassified Fusibacter TaxID=2624464 RepID=UPI001010BFDF|nr:MULTISPECIES: undecaprenyldiphospho-muramoylpentapeptide beta-N-acetylglucosaminyltransferase [unclassified Fusibacter]MCK8061317.1 undecaprenyldiphospho-muramoylpentapeptide beta-N-acetylglucosaminyltransferase [Fusibacter sp. A2]NPE23486.1 undecaprenyldiphospho-muramoylpentapeptide beta-N-acetylglucosaminyltransferase [Fusibacter sp. A1]RXV59092.1 undecaprenyldiphospho-muramoylpentapeptide beta-N-acetylglucosaminyltransferase [Fusibacter sp. A1]
MRMIVTGGGTGGHIYPAVAIAKRVKIAIPDCDMLYIGSEYGLEEKIVKKENLAYQSISVRGFDRKNIFKAIGAGFLLIKSLYQSYKVIRSFKPDLVIGTGGYVSGPVVFIAALLGVDTMIHEQNAVPGLTTSLLSRVANKVLVSYKDSMSYFKKQNKLHYTGNPVREAFSRADRDLSRKKLGIKDDELVILSVGGSGGATTINRLAKILAYEVEKMPNVRYFHITGKRFYDSFLESLELDKVSGRVKVMDYSDDIVTLMAASDLAFSRSGAMSLAEMAAVSLPAILIPSPNVANNHQELNARAFEKIGACVMITEKDLTAEHFLSVINALISQPDKLKVMRGKFESLSRENALNTIMSIIYEYNLR